MKSQTDNIFPFLSSTRRLAQDRDEVRSAKPERTLSAGLNKKTSSKQASTRISKMTVLKVD